MCYDLYSKSTSKSFLIKCTNKVGAKTRTVTNINHNGMSTKRLEIQKGWYRSVGRKYGWTDEHSSEGVGIEREYFNCDELIVVVNKEEYRVDPKVALEHIRKYKSHDNIGVNRIGYIPRTLMEKIV